MSTEAGTVSAKINLKKFYLPKTVISRFIARRTMRGAAFWALAFGAIVASKSVGYATAYPSLEGRIKLAATFAKNIGLNAIFGIPHQIQTIAGFTVWNTLAPMMIVGSIWAFLLATKTLRGEENAGRWELLLSGQTTARRATTNALIGLGSSLATLYVVMSVAFIAIGKLHRVDFDIRAALFFALTGICGAVLFMAVGALASQLMSTRSRAASLSAAIFGAFFLIRVMATTTNVHWLLYVTPLGWIDKLQPLYGSQPLWLLPIFGLALIFATMAIYLAGRRDIESSIIADKDSSTPHNALLNTPLEAAIRLTRAKSLSWLLGVAFAAVFFGLLTKSAAQVISDSSGFQHALSRAEHFTQIVGAEAFISIIFFLLMTIVMAYTASAISNVREDEAEGYLDNFLVRPVSRLRWLWGRISLIVIVIVLAGLIGGAGSWVGSASQHGGIAFHALFLAGLNIIAPAIITLGIGVFILGIAPRFTSLIAYAVIAWSFLLQLLSSGIKLNHWIIDTSVLSHIASAPAVNPNWRSALIVAGIGLIMAIIGSIVFNNRDLQNE